MNDVFVDTSALYAAIVADDAAHPAARRVLEELDVERVDLVTSSFVVQETVSLLQARIGLAAVKEYSEGFEPLLNVVWVDRTLYRRALASLLAASARRISLTDWSSFEIMRNLGIERAFAFDRHFADQGFTVLGGL